MLAYGFEGSPASLHQINFNFNSIQFNCIAFKPLQSSKKYSLLFFFFRNNETLSIHLSMIIKMRMLHNYKGDFCVIHITLLFSGIFHFFSRYSYGNAIVEAGVVSAGEYDSHLTKFKIENISRISSKKKKSFETRLAKKTKRIINVDIVLKLAITNGVCYNVFDSLNLFFVCTSSCDMINSKKGEHKNKSVHVKCFLSFFFPRFHD